MASETLTVTDNRTGKMYELPITAGSIRTMDLRRQVRTDPNDFGLLGYDPAFVNTASTRSAITYIDGDRGVLWYRGVSDREGLGFALMMSVRNGALALADMVGASLIEQGWMTFSTLVVLNAAVVAVAVLAIRTVPAALLYRREAA